MKLKQLILASFLLTTTPLIAQHGTTLYGQNSQDTITLTQNELKTNNKYDLVVAKFLKTGKYILKTPSRISQMYVETTTTTIKDEETEIDLSKSVVDCDGVVVVARSPKYSLVSAIDALISKNYSVSETDLWYMHQANMTPEISSKIKEYSGGISLSKLSKEEALKLFKKVESDMISTYKH